MRVSDGTRTRGHLDHNQVLYQLSYTHHVRLSGFPRPAEKKCTGSEGVLAPALIAQAASLSRAGRPTLLRRQDVLRGDRLGGVGVRPGLRDEDRLAVVAQLRDGLADVGEGTVVAVLLRAVEVGPGVP